MKTINRNLLEKKLNIFIFSFILFSLGSFGVSFFPPDEPKYVDAALRMIETGNYIVPFFNCHIRFDKPILYYWELVVSFKIFGVDNLIRSGHDPLGIIEYAARLPSIIAGSLTAVYVYLLSLEFFKNKGIAINSTIALFSILFFFYLPRAVYPDMSLILFELMAIYYFIKDKYVIAWFFVALAFLTKGPIGIVTPGFTYFLYLWIVKKKSGLKEFFSFYNGLGFVVFLLIGSPWYIIMYKIYGLKFINRFFLYHNIERFTGAAHQHPHSFFYYFPIVIIVLFLWWGYLKELSPKINLKDRYNAFLLAWFLWVILFFSISYNKLPHYIAIAFIPMSIIFGRYVDEIENTRLAKIIMILSELLIMVIAFFYACEEGMPTVLPTVVVGFVAIILVNFVIKGKPIEVVFVKVLVLSVVLSIVLLQLESYRPERRLWLLIAKNHYPLYEYRVNNSSFVAYTRRCLEETNNFNSFIHKKGKFYVYTKAEYLADFKIKTYKIIFTAIDKGKRTILIEVNNG